MPHAQTTGLKAAAGKTSAGTARPGLAPYNGTVFGMLHPQPGRTAFQEPAVRTEERTFRLLPTSENSPSRPFCQQVPRRRMQDHKTGTAPRYRTPDTLPNPTDRYRNEPPAFRIREHPRPPTGRRRYGKPLRLLPSSFRHDTPPVCRNIRQSPVRHKPTCTQTNRKRRTCPAAGARPVHSRKRPRNKPLRDTESVRI